MGSSSSKYLRALKHWTWLILLATVIAGSLAYYGSSRQPRLYETTARLVVGPGVEAVNPDLNAMRAAAQLMWVYAEYATSDPVLQKVIADNNLFMSVERLRSLIQVSPDQTTLWLALRVRSEDPELPAVIANSVADALVHMSPAATELPGDQSQVFLGEQIRQVENDLTAAQEKLAAAEQGLAGTRDPIIQRSYQEQIVQQRAYAADLRSVLTKLYDLYQTSYTNQIMVVEAAGEPRPIATSPALAALLGALSGALAAVGLVLAFAYFDHVIRTPHDLQAALGIPLLGVVVKHKLPHTRQRARHGAAKGSEYLALSNQRT